MPQTAGISGQERHLPTTGSTRLVRRACPRSPRRRSLALIGPSAAGKSRCPANGALEADGRNRPLGRRGSFHLARETWAIDRLRATGLELFRDRARELAASDRRRRVVRAAQRSARARNDLSLLTATTRRSTRRCQAIAGQAPADCAGAALYGNPRL